jgi:hypothetical protein
VALLYVYSILYMDTIAASSAIMSPPPITSWCKTGAPMIWQFFTVNLAKSDTGGVGFFCKACGIYSGNMRKFPIS